MFRTGNPVFTKSDAFQPAQSWDDLNAQGRGYDTESGAPAARGRASHMTIQGSVNKTFLLLAMCTASAIGAWTLIDPAAGPEGMNSQYLMPLLLGGALGGLVLGLITVFAPRAAVVTAPLYALAEGAFVGSISALYAQMFATENEALNMGLIFNAILLTFGITGGMLAGYTTRLIRPGPRFRKFVMTAMLGLIGYFLVAVVASLFGSYSLVSVYDPSNGGLISIGFSLFVVGIATANLVLDFEFIESGSKAGIAKHYEWVGAFGLLVTLVWLYLELLRLLAKLHSRD